MIEAKKAQKRRLYWSVSSNLTDSEAVALFKKRYGRQPGELKRYDRSLILMGPLKEGEQ